MNYQLTYHVYIQDPVIITSVLKNPNTVSSEKYIPGRMILGALAWKYIQQEDSISQLNLYKDAHLDNTFRNLFLTGNVRYGNAFINRGNNTLLPVPLSFREKKSNPDYIIDRMIQQETETTKSLSGYYINSGKYLEVANPRINVNFHHKHNKDEENEIFYYEAIAHRQTFVGTIVGFKDNLTKLIDLFGPELLVKLGKSKNVEYGDTKLALGDIVEIEKDHPFDTNQLILTFVSDTIIRNKYGVSAVDYESILHILQTELPDANISRADQNDLPTAILTATRIEQFNGKWGIHGPDERAIAMGSVIRITVDTNAISELKKIGQQGIGEFNNMGFGRFIIRSVSESEEEYIRKDISELIIEKPSTMIDETKILLINLAKERLLQKINNEAIRFERSHGAKLRELSNNQLQWLIEQINHQPKNIDFNKDLFDDFYLGSRLLKDYLKDFEVKHNIDFATDYLDSDWISIKLKIELFQKKWITILKLCRRRNN